MSKRNLPVFANISIILFSITVSSTAHVLLKKGMSQHQYSALELSSIWDSVFSIATSPWVLLGMILHVAALVIWLWALSRVDITFAYPFLAVGYVLVSLMAWLWLGESITSTRFFGMAVIVVGIVILSRGG
jgi:multidrug transporter EmrE-like cation transporter